ncbi:C-terminal processing peptidase-3. Serine peptidase. MEROPS family S41A [Peptoclostridium litorale DSM 5388]|uniref:Carboxy-terminal-processing protease CtpA n=1 Tax=Peptoclostridium litorale DSM 5388 TaxID=1121324 RepID=A0A069RKS5_PEPLI|nr:S41 family peptidase [Peptoclostridium litorale]KDR94842.1 carboxy-terminal-processing protease CtpA [Peptoclostridium litorale DSM 5388]SIN93888.1 C-terminal processing peptidase-3. Serine peptidase. MEROPS family S41A [Peptoclostridium litorale DSM 5388]
MISNKKAALGAVVVAVIASLFTLNAGIMMGKVAIVPVDKYGQYKKFEKLLALKQEIEGNFYQESDEDKLIEGAINGMFEGLEDPYSDYMTESEFNELIEYTKGSFGGIGVYVAPGEDGLITVVSPIEDTPGDRAGIKAGDKIVGVNGESFTAKELDKAVGKMRGEPGTAVTLTIFREGMAEPFDIDIVREEIRVKTVKSEVKDGDIGYIRITTFDEKTAGEFKANLEDLKDKGIKGLVIDLRGNPGGLLDQCHEIADEILGKGTVVYTRDRSGEEEYLRSDEERKLSMPMAVLVNGGSASASEILSGAIRDNKAGVLIGETTFGKGLVQRVYPLKDGTGYKLTTAQYFTPSGEYINKKGIKPDIEVEDEQEQLDKALEYVKGKIK